MRKRVLSFVLALTMCALFQTTANAYISTYDVQYGDYLYYEINADNTVIITGCDGSAVSIDIPAQIDGIDVTGIGDYAFYRCADLTSVTIPSSVTSIGNYAFGGCTYLTSITIPDSVTSIGNHAFDRCDYLETVTIPSSVTSIGNYAFYWCDIETVTIPSSVTSIGNYAFGGCTKLKSIDVDSGNPNYSSLEGNLYNKDKTEFIQYAMGREDTHYSIPDSVTSIAEGAFFFCIKLTSITIHAGITSIGRSAFTDCYGLTNISVDSDNTSYSSVDGNLFNKDKTTLVQYAIGKADTYYTIPDSVTSISDCAFADCGLETVTIPSSVTSIGDEAFSNCFSLTDITIPNSVISIGDNGFAGCEGLTSVTMLGGVTTIGSYAFFLCVSLKSVTIPNSIISIGDSAFGYCDSLTDVYYTGTKAEWNKIKDNGGLYGAVNIHFLGDEPDIKISNVTENKSDHSVSANFQSNSPETQTFEAICAVYDKNGALITYDSQAVTFDFGEARDLTFELSVSDWASCKIFAWDELGTMRPLSRPALVTHGV